MVGKADSSAPRVRSGVGMTREQFFKNDKGVDSSEMTSESILKKCCQGGKSDRIDASDCDDGKYKVQNFAGYPLAI